MAPSAGRDGNLAQIDRRLRDHVAELVGHLRGQAPDKARSTRQTIRFGRKGGLAVDVDGPNKGRITDFNDGGDKAKSPLQFIQSELGVDFSGSVRWARAWLGIEGGRPEPRVRRENAESSKGDAGREEAERRGKVARIVAETVEIAGTPAQAYLRARGIMADPPPAARWRPRAWGGYGSLVLLATDAGGAVRAVQQVYLTADGAKAPIAVQKRTNGAQAGAAVRLPGKAPLILAEGPEDALSLWQATGQETWAALGGIGKLVGQVPPGSDVIVARDADPEGSPADKALWRAVEALIARGCRGRLACPPRYESLAKTDFNDVLRREGEAGIIAAIAAAGTFGPPAPRYPAAALSTERAVDLLNHTVADWVGHAVTHAEGDPARQVGVRAAAGLGKSRAVLHALRAHPRAPERHIDILVPRHDLADEFAREAAGGPLRVRVIRGREYQGADGATMCAKADEAGKVARAGFSVWEHMCRRVDPETGREEVCERFASCPYVAQFDDPEPAVRIMTHESMFLPRNGGLPDPQAVVIDESFHAKAARQADFALDRLNAGLWRRSGRGLDMGDLDRRDRVARAVRRALEAGEHPRDHGVTAEDCRMIARMEIGGVENIGITPGMSHAAQRRRLASYQRTEALKLHRFWRILAVEIDRAGPLRQIELRRDVVRWRGDEMTDRLHVFWRRDLELPDVPVLLLDADLDPIIGAKFLPRLEMVEVPVERRAEVIQVMDTPCSRRKLLAWDGAPEDEVRRATNRLADLQALFDLEADKGARVLLVTYKKAAERLRTPAGCAVEWFGNIRGIDRHKGFDTVIIAGREQPPVEAIEAQARALFADDPEPMNPTGVLVERNLGYRTRDGRPAEAMVWVHSDPRVLALLEQVRERETGQAIDRLRLIHRSTPARVIVLSNVVLDLTVDTLVTWREITPNALDRMVVAGAVPLAPWADMAEAYPNLFPTGEAARKLVGRLTPDKSHIEYLIGKCPELRILTYRRARSGQRAVIGRLAYDPRRIDPRAWLARNLLGAEPITLDARSGKASEAPPMSMPAGLAPSHQGSAPDGTFEVAGSRCRGTSPRAFPRVADPNPTLEGATPPPSPTDDIGDPRRLEASASRLASLSARLARARPPRPWGDHTDLSRERTWRARMWTAPGAPPGVWLGTLGRVSAGHGDPRGTVSP